MNLIKLKVMKLNNMKKTVLGLAVMAVGALNVNIVAGDERLATEDYLGVENYSEEDINEIYAHYELPEIIFAEDLLSEQGFSTFAQEELIYTFGGEFIQNHENALSQLSMIHSSFPQDRLGNIMLPAFYGGSYINYYGNLVVLLVNEFSHLNNLRVATATRVVNYSHDLLSRIMDYLFDILMDESLDTSNISYVWLDTINNKIVIALYEYHDDKTENFKRNLFDHSSLHFTISAATPKPPESPNYEMGSDLFERSTVVNPGTAISLTSGGTLDRSIGFRARNRHNIWGFVTAAHQDGGSLRYHQRFFTGTRYVGSVTQVQLSGIDAAFVTLANGLTMSSVAVDGSNTGIHSTNPVVGSMATRISAGNTTSPLISSGIIRSTNFIWDVNGQPARAVRADNMFSLGGDSGGIVVHGSGGNFSIGGILVARFLDGSGSLYTAAPIINSVLALATN